MKVLLCGDVITGRGIGQILPSPADPALRERYCRSALDYVALAERASGPVPRPDGFDCIWGDLLGELERRAPDLRIVNLETSVTADGTPVPKGTNYRMHPANLPCLAAARIDCCVLAYNHVLDWGVTGLTDTLDPLHRAGIATAGAGVTLAEAAEPATLAAPGARLPVFAYGCPSSGIPVHWAADRSLPGADFVPDLSDDSRGRVARDIDRHSAPGDAVIVSIHWGQNWGRHAPGAHRRFAQRLIAEAGAHVVHGRSSHHPLGIELHDGHPIPCGCGDLINDCEGIGGYEEFRDKLALAWFLELSPPDHTLHGPEMAPFRRRRFSLTRPADEDLAWLRTSMDRQCRAFGHSVDCTPEGALRLNCRDRLARCGGVDPRQGACPANGV